MGPVHSARAAQSAGVRTPLVAAERGDVRRHAAGYALFLEDDEGRGGGVMAHTGHVWDCDVFACADTCYEVVVSFGFGWLVRIVRDSDARILRYSGQLLNIVSVLELVVALDALTCHRGVIRFRPP